MKRFSTAMIAVASLLAAARAFAQPYHKWAAAGAPEIEKSCWPMC